MNYSTSVMLINTNIRAIRALYEPDLIGPNGTTIKKQTRTLFKTLDPSIKVGDLVIVPSSTRHGFTTNKVEEVDVDVDFEDNIEVKWIVDKIVFDGYDTVLREETKWIDQCKKAERRDQSQKLKDKMFAYYKDADATPMALLTGTVDHVDVTAAPVIDGAVNTTTTTST